MKISTELEKFKRKSWKPITTDSDGSPTDSKFAGTAFIKKGEDYPVCLNCNNPLQLFLQLNLSQLPTTIGEDFGQGLVQFFYCTTEDPLCEVDCNAFFPFAKSVLTRLITPENLQFPIEDSVFNGSFPPKLITDWEENDDYPNREEGEVLGIELEEDVWGELSEEDYPHGGDKLAGYPMWVQGIEYPNCPVCKEQMRLLFQIDSEDNLPFMFGDVGCGHLTQCETHKEQLAFGWACS